ncbi:MAG: valine--tRNA ligase, partial [Nanoarchaeota archaeon]|nr:valine--tRNA ligase [Nanoarchaeota archaeon]
YSTIDKQPTRVSQQSFIDLLEKELVYKKETPVTWCVKCQTAIAQADFENIEKESVFNDIAFHDAQGKELLIATTRPELIPACVALAAHPEDERYAYLKGKTAKVPLFDYEVPIIYDEDVAMDKGTGLMMVCTFGDKEDVEKWNKHQLDLRVIFEKYGKLNSLAGKYEGLGIKNAREEIIKDLKEAGHLKGQKQIVHNTNTHDRCGTEIEFMKTPQWFIKVIENKEKLVAAADQINWHPEHMKVRYVHWVENLNWDWCISRQRHFGVPFPVWYEKDTGNMIVAKSSDLPIDPASQTPSWYEKDPSNLIPEQDVMDTWATSSVTPQIALDWKGKTSDEEFAASFPMTLRMQAHDIIRTWAFYTIVKGMYNNDSIPWQNIMVSGFVLDPQGKKMSKSKGNTIDPIALTDKYGADSVRYAASAVKLGEDAAFKDKYLETGKKLVTKIFNASKFVHMHLEDFNQEFDEDKLTPIDRWIISKCNDAANEASNYLEEYEFAKARAAIEKFFWNFCDNYLEIVKDRLYKPEVHGTDSRLAGQMTLSYVLDTTLRLFAPYLPFITDEVYSWKLAKEGADSVHTKAWPEPSEAHHFPEESEAGDLAVEIIAACRREKTNNGVSQKHEIEALTIQTSEEVKTSIETVLEDIKMTVSAKEIIFGEVPTHTGVEANEGVLNIDEKLLLKISLAPKEE